MFTQMGTSGNLPFYFFFYFFLYLNFITITIITLLLSLLLYTYYLTILFFLFFTFVFYFLFCFFFSYTFLFMFLSFPLFSLKKTSLAGVEPAIFRFVVWRVSIAPQALTIILSSVSSPFYSCSPCPWVDFPLFIIGRFISSRIHPFPSEHGSKDA